MPGNGSNQNPDIIIDKKSIFILKLLSRIIEVNKQQSTGNKDNPLEILKINVILNGYYKNNTNSFKDMLNLLSNKDTSSDIIEQFRNEIDIDKNKKEELIKKLKKIKDIEEPHPVTTSTSPHQRPDDNEDEQLKGLQIYLILNGYYKNNTNSFKDMLNLLSNKDTSSDIIKQFIDKTDIDEDKKKKLLKKLHKIIKADQSPQSPQSSQSPQSLQPE